VSLLDGLADVRDALERNRSPHRFRVVRTRRTEERAPIDPGVRRAVYARDGWRCQWCLRSVNEVQSLQLDHLVPWSAGGSDEPDNLRTLCGDCNEFRSNFDIDTVVRRPPLASGCSVCDPDWEDLYGWYREGAVYCSFCRRVNVGAVLRDERRH
jgi:5-methylcytosine-specific restriction endonuclease McrA